MGRRISVKADQYGRTDACESEWNEFFLAVGGCRSVEGHNASQACQAAPIHCAAFNTTTEDDWLAEKTLYLKILNWQR